MKKLLTLIFIIFGYQAYAQVSVLNADSVRMGNPAGSGSVSISGKTYLKNITEGNSHDSVLVRGAAGIVKFVKRSAFAEAGIPLIAGDGSFPINGKLVFNTILQKLRIYDASSSSWKDAISVDLSNYYSKIQVDALLAGLDSYTASNGITKTGNNFALGGTLTSAVNIGTATNGLFLDPIAGDYGFYNGTNSLGLNLNSVYLEKGTAGSLGNQALYINFINSGITFIDRVNNRGIEAYGDYEANYIPRSYVSKRYVDSLRLSVNSDFIQASPSSPQNKFINISQGIKSGGINQYNYNNRWYSDASSGPGAPYLVNDFAAPNTSTNNSGFRDRYYTAQVAMIDEFKHDYGLNGYKSLSFQNAADYLSGVPDDSKWTQQFQWFADGRMSLLTSPLTATSNYAYIVRDNTTGELKQVSGGGVGSSYTFNNGITNTSGTVGLGGNVTWNIPDSVNLRVANKGYLYVNGIGSENGYLSVPEDKAVYNSATKFGMSSVFYSNGKQTGLSIQESDGFTIFDEIKNKGLEAQGNYEANYTSKSYVSKRYVDSLRTSINNSFIQASSVSPQIADINLKGAINIFNESTGTNGISIDADGAKIGRLQTFNYYNQSTIAGFKLQPTQIFTETPYPEAQFRYDPEHLSSTAAYLLFQNNSYAPERILTDTYTGFIKTSSDTPQIADINIKGSIKNTVDIVGDNNVLNFKNTNAAGSSNIILEAGSNPAFIYQTGENYGVGDNNTLRLWNYSGGSDAKISFRINSTGIGGDILSLHKNGDVFFGSTPPTASSSYKYLVRDTLTGQLKQVSGGGVGSSYTFSNGLSQASGVVSLGGNTNASFPNNFMIRDTDGLAALVLSKDTKISSIGYGGNQAYGSETTTGITFSNGSNVSNISLSSAKMKVIDNINHKGLEDDANYDGNKTANSYVTKRMLDSVAVGAGLSQIDNNLTASTTRAPSKTAVNTGLALKQDLLVSATNIKTVNGSSILGSGNLVVSASQTLDQVLTTGNTSTQTANVGTITASAKILGKTTSGTGDLQIGADASNGNFRVIQNGGSSMFGTYDSVNSKYYGFRNDLGTPIANFIGLGGWYQGIASVAGVTSSATDPIFGVVTTNQTGNTPGKGGTNFHVSADKHVETFNNILDNGSGVMQIASLTSSQAVFTDGSKNLVSVAVTGTGNAVRAASPTLTGTPLAPTATSGTNTTQIATTEFVQAALSKVTINTQTANYTLTLADAGKFVQQNVSSANSVTVPPNSTVAFPIGTQILLRQMGTGQVTIAAGSGVTLQSADNALKSRVQFAPITLIKVATNTWAVMGDLTL
jgi:hypothetical protein